jgi:hypothetical protein
MESEYVFSVRYQLNFYIPIIQIKRSLGRPKRTWENNIKRDLREIGWGGMDGIDLSQDRNQWRWSLVNTVMNLRVCVAERLAAS